MAVYMVKKTFSTLFSGFSAEKIILANTNSDTYSLKA